MNVFFFAIFSVRIFSNRRFSKVLTFVLSNLIETGFGLTGLEL